MTRFGCIGCFSIIAVIALVAVVLLGGIALSTNLFEVPDLPRQDFSPEDGRRFQQKLAEIMLREANISSRRDPIVISQRELNAFLQRHLLESEQIRISPMVVQFVRGTIEVQGQTELRYLLAGYPFSFIAQYLPQSATNRLVWISVKGRVKVERGRGEFVAQDFTLGRQSLSPWLLSWLFGGAGSRLMQWRVPTSVDRITIEEGRAIVTLRRS
ncbi:MAG TPA: hypothetical protein VJO34_11450 [Methylomirabilota bacterium]|nr:hypothetical protein [Methylomirabilota bacterium]